MAQCALTPKVRTRDGVADSILYKDLTALFGRPVATRIYKTVKNIDPSDLAPLGTDGQGEPTVAALLRAYDMSGIISEYAITMAIAEKEGFMKGGVMVTRDATPAARRDMAEKAWSFNERSPYSATHVATPVIRDGMAGVTLETANDSNTRAAVALSRDMAVATALRDAFRDATLDPSIADDMAAAHDTDAYVRAATEALAVKDGGMMTGPMALALTGGTPLRSRVITAAGSVKAASDAVGKALRGETPDTAPTLAYRVAAMARERMGKVDMGAVRATLDTPRPGSLFSGVNDSRQVRDFDTRFRAMSDDTERESAAISHAIGQARKAQYSALARGSGMSARMGATVNAMRELMEGGDTLAAAMMFLSKMTALGASLTETFMSLNGSGNEDPISWARLLRDMRDYGGAVADALLNIEGILEYGKGGDVTKDERRKMRRMVSEIRTYAGRMDKVRRDRSVAVFASFLRRYAGDTYARYIEQAIINTGATFEDLLRLASSKDISLWDRYVNAAAKSGNLLIRMVDRVIKEFKARARLMTLEHQKAITAAAVALEEAGHKDTAWMFKRGVDGQRTDKYVTPYDFDAYEKAREAEAKRIKARHPDMFDPMDAFQAMLEMQEWERDNTERAFGGLMPSRAKYSDPAWDGLDDAQKAYATTIFTLKHRLDRQLPEGTMRLDDVVKMRADLHERLKAAGDLREAGGAVWTEARDIIMRRSDDTDYGIRPVRHDPVGRPVELLPMFYTRLREGETMDDMSPDVTTAMMAYASMSNDYASLSRAVDALEIGRDVMRKQDVTDASKQQSRAASEGTNLMKRLDELYEMQLYGRYQKDEGSFLGADIGKTANAMNAMTSLYSMTVNLMQALSNVVTGKVMARVEAIGGEHFGYKDLLAADRVYGIALPSLLAELPDRVKTSKLALFMEMFDVEQQYDRHIRSVDFERRSWLERLMTLKTLYFLNNAGEHYLQARTALAMAHRYKMVDANGRETTLWDALTVEPVDASDMSRGARLVIRDGYKKADGGMFTASDITKFTLSVGSVNRDLHGTYNLADRNVVQKYALGRMAMMFAKWIPTAITRRLGSRALNFETGNEEEGYWRTSWRFLRQLARDAKTGGVSLSASWDDMTGHEKGNIRKTVAELAHFVALWALCSCYKWDDDDDRGWLSYMVEYQCRRLLTEVGSAMPLPTTILFNEVWNKVKSPFPGMRMFDNINNIIKLLDPDSYEAVGGKDARVKSGKYKGWSKAEKAAFELIPGARTVMRNAHPEESVDYYKGIGHYF